MAIKFGKLKNEKFQQQEISMHVSITFFSFAEKAKQILMGWPNNKLISDGKL